MSISKNGEISAGDFKPRNVSDHLLIQSLKEQLKQKMKLLSS